MPIYQFECLNCNNQYDLSFSMDKIAKTKPICPKCKKKLKRVYSFTAKTNKSNNKIPSCPTGSCPFLNN